MGLWEKLWGPGSVSTVKGDLFIKQSSFPENIQLAPLRSLMKFPNAEVMDVHTDGLCPGCRDGGGSVLLPCLPPSSILLFMPLIFIEEPT